MWIPLDATEYMFQGDGITASITLQEAPAGRSLRVGPETFFVYQDHHLSKTFSQAGVDIQQIDNVGALVSVVLVESPISGGPVTTFTVLVPSVGVTEDSPQKLREPSRLPRFKGPPWCRGKYSRRFRPTRWSTSTVQRACTRYPWSRLIRKRSRHGQRAVRGHHREPAVALWGPRLDYLARGGAGDRAVAEELPSAPR